MKFKVGFLDRILFRDFLYILSIVGVIFSIFSIVLNVTENAKMIVGASISVILLIVYIFLWIRANKLTRIELSVDNSKVVIKIGDIFQEQGFKVIGFNEYFDTIVDNKIISENTLNGIYLKNVVTNIDHLNKLIELDESLKEKIVNSNENRTRGNKQRYKLGTIFRNDDFLLTAFSKFDNDNRAFLYMNDYINLLLNFWNEIDIVYSGKSVSIPLMGSGITRFKEYNNITDQELLELLLWSFKISRIKFTYPSTVTIIIHETRKDKINFYKLKEVI